MTEPPIRFPDGFRLLVCGGRDYADRSHVWATLDRVHRKRPLGLVIHGASRGADTLAADWALERSIETWAFPAAWAEAGWAPSCACPANTPVPCAVLDPFGGAGTTALVADRIRRDATIIDLNPEYREMAKDRVQRDAPLLAVVA